MENSLSYQERDNPFPPNTKCKALYTFTGERSQDLSFTVGEELIIIKPSSVMYWYVAKNGQGKKGNIPITFVEVVEDTESNPKPPALPPRMPKPPPITAPKPTKATKSSTLPPHRHSALQKKQLLGVTSSDDTSVFSSIDSRPPMPLPPHSNRRRTRQKPSFTNKLSVMSGKYTTIQSFSSESGWFTPTVDMVLSTKLDIPHHVFRRMRCAVYYFQHKYDPTKQFAGKSLQVYEDLTQLFTRLYEKTIDSLNPLEVELRFHSSDAVLWNVRAWEYSYETLDLELAKVIVKQKCLRPNGLNKELSVISSDFGKFCEWYTQERRNAKD